MGLLGRESGPVVVGHRGGCGAGWPAENTLPAFERARVEGAHAVEMDVRLCATGEVIVFHDPDLTRMTGGADRRLLASVGLGELRTAGLLGTDARVPTLANVVDWSNEHTMPLNIEIKHDVPDRAALVRATVRALAGAKAPLVVSSFDPLTLVRVAALSPRTPRALLTDPKQRYAAILHTLARRSLLFGLHVERRQATPQAVHAWKGRGLRVGVWTVNGEGEAAALARCGVDLLITDAPGAILRAISVVNPA